MNSVKVLFNILLFGVLFYGAICLLMYLFQEKMLFHPQILKPDYEFQFSTPSGFDEIYLEVNDGVKLHGLFFKNENPKGVILYFHGNAGSLVGWGTVALDFIELGYEVLIMDYRGYGKSGGYLKYEMLLEDAQMWYNHLASKYNQDQIIVYGRSLGTGFAIPLAVQNEPRLLILETPFYSMADLARRHFPGFPHSLLLRFRFPNNKLINHVQCPVYVFHGTQDDVIPYQSAKLLEEAATEAEIEFTTIEGGGHNNLSTYSQYFDRLRVILE